MSTFSDIVQDFFAAAAGPRGGDFGTRLRELIEAIRNAPPDEVSWLSGPLVELVARVEAPRPSVLGLLGELVCRGASFWGLAPHLVAGIRHHLKASAQFERLLRPMLPAGKKFHDLPLDEAATIVDALPESAKAQLQQWELLPFLLGPSMPIFEQVAPFRKLARAMRIDADWLRDSVSNVPWLPQLPALLAEHQAADGPLLPPLPAIEQALTPIRRAANTPAPSPRTIQPLLQPVFEVTTFVSPDAFTRTAAALARIASMADPAWASQLAGVAGSFAERGADPDHGADALLYGLPRLLDPVVAFVEACRARGVEEGESALEKHADAVGKEMPEALHALEAISGYCLGTIAHLARSPAARQRHGKDTKLIDKVNRVRWDTGNTGFLWKMLQVLDGEELVILAPAYSAGWKVKIGGIGDNFQLHALIGGHLVAPRSEGKYPGTVSTHDVKPEPGPGVPLSARAIATQTDAPCLGKEPAFSSNFQLWNWMGLQKDGTLPANPIGHHDHWIWNEGIPADIMPFEGTRVVLLGESTIQRNWNGGRIFPFMRASFEVVETMREEAVKEWLGRIVQSRD